MDQNTGRQKIVFASANTGKIAELHELLEPLGLEVVPQEAFGIDSVDETAHTFVENALLKARHATLCSGLPAIADDSGLEVDALNGAPGLYSARYAERHSAGRGDVSKDVANYEFLLSQLADFQDFSQRRARFKSVVVHLAHPHDPSPVIAEGSWEGHIMHQAVAGGGFGYDPVFCNHDTDEAASLLDKQTKNRLSHRGKAVALMIARLRERL